MIMEQRSRPKQKISSLFQHFRRPLLLILSLLILVAGYFLILQNPIRIYQENYGLLLKLNGDIALANDNLKIAKQYSDKIYELSPLDTKLLNMSMPGRLDDSALVSQLTAMSERAGFIVNNIDIESAGNAPAAKTAAADHIGRVSVRLKLKNGGYNELKQLLQLMETSLMMIDVVSVNFSDKSPTYDIALVVYYYNNNSLSIK